MKKEYGLSKLQSRTNPYASELKKTVNMVKLISCMALVFFSMPICSETIEKCKENNQNDRIDTVEIVVPEYPEAPMAIEMEGYVKLQILVNSNGEVDQAFVTEAQPPRRFDRSAIRAIKKSIFSKSPNKYLRCGVYTYIFKLD